MTTCCRAASEYVHVHFGVGCDLCGMYPIRGGRFKCIDCYEAIGFDLVQLQSTF